ncbi:hypothetical protein AAC387_Pa01g3717 [Persea americana]
MDLGGFFKGKDGQSPDKSAANTPSATPPLQMVLRATKGATDAFSNVGRQVNITIRRLSVKSTESRGGHGIGFGYGFGVGSTAKPGVAHKFQSCFRQAIIKMMVKLGILPSFPFDQSNIPGSLQSGVRLISGTSDSNLQSSVTNIMQLVTKTAESMPHGPSKDGSSNVVPKQESFSLKGTPSEASVGSRSEMVIRSFLQSPILKTDETEHNDMAARQGRENNMLQMLLKHQQIIEELMEENKKLRRILVEDLKVPSDKLQASNEDRTKHTDPCSDCIDSQRREKK